MDVCGTNPIDAGKRRDEHQQSRLRQVKVGQQQIDDLKAVTRRDEERGFTRAGEDCRFRDCRHTNEPGCAVVAAVEDGRLDRDRVASYRKLQSELEESVKEPWLKAAESQQAKIVHKAMKKMPKKKR